MFLSQLTCGCGYDLNKTCGQSSLLVLEHHFNCNAFRIRVCLTMLKVLKNFLEDLKDTETFMVPEETNQTFGIKQAVRYNK